MDETVDFQLSVFKTVVETGSIAAAAAALSISKSSVSRHVQDLETAFKESLFDRADGEQGTVTPAGRRAYQYAALLDQSARLVREGRVGILQPKAESAVLSIGAHDFVADRRLPFVMDEFLAQRPGTEFDLRRGRSSAIEKLVRDKKIDLGFVLVSVDEKIDGLNAESVDHERLAIFAVPGHPLAHRRDVSPAEVSSYPFVTPGGGTTVDDRRILSLLSRMGLHEVRLATEPPGAANWYGLGALSPNLCLAIHSRVEAELERGELVEVDIDATPVFFEVQVIWRDDWEISAASRAFLAFLLSHDHHGSLPG